VSFPHTPQPTSGTLSIRVIRACRVHAECALECPERKVLDRGVVASFDRRFDIKQKIKEAYWTWRHSSQASE